MDAGMKKILTVIVPTYNMEQYLDYCLSSLCVKRHAEAVEVLIVNDGSTDSSSAIAHGFAARCPDLFRVIDKANGNYGSCVNRGLQEATGKYVKVLDADDSFSTERFERFLGFLLEEDADLVLSDFVVVDTTRTVRKRICYNLGSGRRFELDEVCRKGAFCCMQMHAVTYRRELLQRMGYHQTEGVSYTDQQWIALPMVRVRTVARFPDYVYEYLVGRTGQTVAPSVKIKSLSDTARCALGMVEGYKKWKAEAAGRPVHDYLLGRIVPMVKEVYVTALTCYSPVTRKLLNDFDSELETKGHDVHEYVASQDVSSFCGVRYLECWRRHRRTPMWIVSLLSRTYVLLIKLRRLGHKEGAMEVPVSF